MPMILIRRWSAREAICFRVSIMALNTRSRGLDSFERWAGAGTRRIGAAPIGLFRSPEDLLQPFESIGGLFPQRIGHGFQGIPPVS